MVTCLRTRQLGRIYDEQTRAFNTVIRGLDIFCGVGGSSAGPGAAGVEVVSGIDMCSLATETFSANFSGSRVITNRLEDIDLDTLKKHIGRIDILLASPECTNHTCARGSAPRDEGSQATAMLVIDYVRVFRPRWLVVENVIQMRTWSRYGELKHALENLGYYLEEQILDSSEFGVAQTRRRLFLMGDRKKKLNLVISKCPGRRKPAQSILDATGIWKTSPLFNDRRAPATLERAKRGFKALGKDASFLLVYYGSDGSGGWQPLSRPLRTITTLDRFALVEGNGNGSRMRMLQVPELKRAMGFSENFKLPAGTRRDRIRLLGNAVCPPVMEAIVRSLTWAQ